MGFAALNPTYVLLNAAVQHAVAMHGYQDSPQLREQLQKMFKEEHAAAAH